MFAYMIFVSIALICQLVAIRIRETRNVMEMPYYFSVTLILIYKFKLTCSNHYYQHDFGLFQFIISLYKIL